MKKIVPLVVVLCLLFIPATVFADGPGPDPDRIPVAVNDYSNVESIEFLGSTDGAQISFVQSDQYPQDTRKLKEKVVEFYNDNGQYKSFKLRVTLTDGSTVESNAVSFQEWGSYIYDVKNNALSEGAINSWRMNGMYSFFVLFFLILPLGITVIVEWLISLAFCLKPGKYVVIINFITNPIMNILILILFNFVYLNYFLIVLLLEIAVGVVEYIFYMKKYRNDSKRRLMLFTAAANLASWGIYSLISNGWFY